MTLTSPSTPACRPSLDEVRALAAEHDLVPVTTELLADCDTPVSAFLRLGISPGSFLLESVEGGERLARYSFLGRDPVCTIALRDGVATVTQADGRVEKVAYTGWRRSQGSHHPSQAGPSGSCPTRRQRISSASRWRRATRWGCPRAGSRWSTR